MGLEDKARIAPKNAWHFAKFAHPNKPLDIVFLDPPYLDSRDSEQGSPLAKLLVDLAQPRLLAENAIVVLRHESAYPSQDKYGRLVRTDTRRYGSMALSFLTPTGTPD
jgi:16S rRNA G966 N2-methylase RsmD